MTPNELRELEQAATEGPWIIETRLRWAVNGADRHVAMVNCGPGGHEGDHDAVLVAASRNILPTLINLWEAVREQQIMRGELSVSVENALRKLEEL